MDDNNAYRFYSADEISRYLSGRMTAHEMHELEKAALRDPMLADAIDGYRKANPKTSAANLEYIKTKILGTATVSHEKFSVKDNNNFKVWKLLAAACILAAMSWVAWWMMKPTIDKPIAKAEQKIVLPDSQNENTEVAKTNTNDGLEAITENSVSKEKKGKPQIIKPENDIAKHKNVKSNSELTDAPQVAAAPVPSIQDAKTNSKNVQPKTADQEIPAFNAEGSTMKEGVAIASASTPSHQNARLKSMAPSPATKDTGNEVVIVGYPTKKQSAKMEDFKKFRKQIEPSGGKNIAYPEEGWSSFYQELENELGIDRSKLLKTVQIKFTLDDEGEPTNFIIVESADEVLIKKAIELIKKSKWKNFKLNKNAVVKIEIN